MPAHQLINCDQTLQLQTGTATAIPRSKRQQESHITVSNSQPPVTLITKSMSKSTKFITNFTKKKSATILV
jgi:hypothetical protein